MNDNEKLPKLVSLAVPTLVLDIIIPVLIVLLWIFQEHIHYPLSKCISTTILLVLVLILINFPRAYARGFLCHEEARPPLAEGLHPTSLRTGILVRNSLNHSCFLEKKRRDPAWIEKQKILFEEEMSRYRNWNVNMHGGCYPLTLTFKKMFIATAALTTLTSFILIFIFWGKFDIFFKIAIAAPFAMWCLPLVLVFMPCAKIYNSVFKNDFRKTENAKDLIRSFFADEILSDESVGTDPYRKDIYQAYQLMLRYTKYWTLVFIVLWCSLIVICFLRMR